VERLTADAHQFPELSRDRVSVLTLVNDESKYRLMRESFATANGLDAVFLPIDADGRGMSASEGLNWGLDRADTEWCIMVHQDVIIPPDWWLRFKRGIDRAPEQPAIAGIFGCADDGRFIGHILDPHGHSRGGPLPSAALTLDEALIAVRSTPGVRFDEGLPGFHCYGADLCLAARHANLPVVAVDAPVVHMSGGRLDEAYQKGADYLTSKWGPLGHRLIPTPAKLIVSESERNAPFAHRARLVRRRSRKSLPCSCAIFARGTED
jgi:hypothetical protein